MKIGDPLAKLLLTNNNPGYSYARKLFSLKGMCDSRLEISFYGSQLKTIETYDYIIKKLFPSTKKGFITDLPVFSSLNINYYLNILLKGQ